MQNAMSDRDLAALDTLIGLALIDDQVRSALLSSEDRQQVFSVVPLSVGATQYLNSLDTAPDLNTFAGWILDSVESQSRIAVI